MSNSETVSSVIPRALYEQLERYSNSLNMSKSGVVRWAIEWYLDAQTGVESVPLAQTSLVPIDTPRESGGIVELRETIADVIDFIPPVAARGETGPVTTSFPKDLLRALDILLTQPAIRQATRSDLIRALVTFGVQAIDRMQMIEHPTWRAATSYGRRRIAFERQLALSEDLYSSSRSFVQSLAASLAQGMVDQAIMLWADFYSEALDMGDSEAAILLKVLRDSPIAVRVAWLGRGSGIIPEEFIPEEEVGDGDEESLDEGLPVPPHIKSRRITLSKLEGGMSNDR